MYQGKFLFVRNETPEKYQEKTLIVIKILVTVGKTVVFVQQLTAFVSGHFKNYELFTAP